MATPTYASKRYYAAGAKKGAEWGTAVALGATNGLLILNDGGLGLKQSYQGYDAIDQIMTMDGDLGPSEAIDFNPEFALQYEMGALGSLIAGLFGTAGTPATLTTGAYAHTFQTADSVTNFFTVAREWPGVIWEVPSAMPYKLSLKLGNARIMATLGMRGNTLTSASGTNGATQMDAITYASRATRVHFSQGVFLMNTQAGGALSGTTDTLEVSDFEIDYERAIDAVQIAGGSYIALPREGASPKVTVKLTLPRASATNLGYLTSFTGMTAQKMTVTFTGAVITGAYSYGFQLGFPRLKFMAPPEPSTDDVIKTVLTFQAEEAAAAPTGMSYTRPYAVVTNARSSDYLA